MHRYLFWLAAAACAPPPPVKLPTPPGETGTTTTTGTPAPSIEFLYPLPGQDVHVTGCTLQEPLIVLVENYALVPFGPDHPDDVDGEGHWHGGLEVNLDQGTGYCAAWLPFCEPGQYDGTTNLHPGRQNLSAYLATNTHQILEPEVEATVEINVIDDDGSCSSTTGGSTGDTGGS